MRKYSEYNRKPETCTPKDWLDGWNGEEGVEADHELNLMELFCGLGSCIGRYPMSEVMGLIEDGTYRCDDRDHVQEFFRNSVNCVLEEGLPELRLLPPAGGGKVTRAQLLELQAYYKQIDEAKAAAQQGGK